jgi:DNA-directed RNA polymerase subunit RPC12/RpoP
MPSQEYPCPHCQKGLPFDERIAGKEIVCPYCDEHVRLPRQLPAAAEEDDADAAAADDESYHGSDSDAAGETDDAAPPPKVAEVSREAELQRLAAMAGTADINLQRFEKKGMIAFACPLCHRPNWVAKKDAGAVFSCEGCSVEIVAPVPDLGLPARVADGGESAPKASLPKAVLPAARKVHNQPLSEGLPRGKPKRESRTRLPGEDADSPEEESEEIHRQVQRAPRVPKLEPIPAKADEVIAPSGRPAVLPTERRSVARTGGAKARPPGSPPRPNEKEHFAAPVHAETSPGTVRPPTAAPPDDASGNADSDADDSSKGLVRLNEDRRHFKPMGTVEGDLEVKEQWGTGEKRRPLAQRFAVLGWMLLIPVLLITAIWGMREVFRKKDPEGADAGAGGRDKPNEAANVHYARAVMDKFFAGGDIEAMSQYVRHPDITLPRMKAYYKKPPAKYEVQAFEAPNEGALDGMDFISGAVTLGGEKPRVMFLEIPKAGSANTQDLLIDWESWVSWSEVPWEDFMRDEMTNPVEFRVILTEDDYPNQPFEDRLRWVCFKLQLPSSYGRDYGYCFGYTDLNAPVTSEIALHYASAKRMGERAMNCMVTIHFIPASKGRKNFVPQVLIERFRPGWLVVGRE